MDGRPPGRRGRGGAVGRLGGGGIVPRDTRAGPGGSAPASTSRKPTTSPWRTGRPASASTRSAGAWAALAADLDVIRAAGPRSLPALSARPTCTPGPGSRTASSRPDARRWSRSWPRAIPSGTWPSTTRRRPPRPRARKTRRRGCGRRSSSSSRRRRTGSPRSTTLTAFLTEKGDAGRPGRAGGARSRGRSSRPCRATWRAAPSPPAWPSGDETAMPDGLRFLRGGTLADDAAERVATALDRPEWIDRLPPEDLVLIGESERNARHFDRAIDAPPARPAPACRTSGTTSSSRSAAPTSGANITRTPRRPTWRARRRRATARRKANFLYNAARCAQLLGDDARAERYLTSAIAPGGKTTRASSALTQRLRIRIAEAAGSRRRRPTCAPCRRASRRATPSSRPPSPTRSAPSARGKPDAGPGRAGAGSSRGCSRRRTSRRSSTGRRGRWRGAIRGGRCASTSRCCAPTPPPTSPYFARHRLAEEPLAAHACARRRPPARRRSSASWTPETWTAARQAQTDVALLAPPDQEAGGARPAGRHLPQLPALSRGRSSCPPPEYPRFPLFGGEGAAEPGRLDLLLAMGLFDDATDLIQARYPLAAAARQASRGRKRCAAGWPRACPSTRRKWSRATTSRTTTCRQLLPRARAGAALPALLLRRDPGRSRRSTGAIRASCCRSCARSRGSTRGRSRRRPPAACSSSSSPPRGTWGRPSASCRSRRRTSTTRELVIQLGAKYIADLLGQFERDGYKAAAAYNAGPNQARLWARMAPGARARHVPVRDQLRRDEGLRAQGPQQLRALRGDLREPAARGRRAAGALALALGAARRFLARGCRRRGTCRPCSAASWPARA